MKYSICIFFLVIVCCESQRDASLPLSLNSLRQILRAKTMAGSRDVWNLAILLWIPKNVDYKQVHFPGPEGRSWKVNDILFQHYTSNSSDPTSYRIRDVDRLRSSPEFERQKRTVIYAHGYIEYTSDASVQTIVAAYQRDGRHNILVVDWSNIAFGDFINVALGLKSAGIEIGKAISKLLRGGLSREGLHFVGHSLGVHLMAAAARTLAAAGISVPRLTGLDPAYPGFYPPLLGTPVSTSDAEFVDIVHTDGGGYGTPQATGHADFWPNGGTAKQPGCIGATLFLSTEDFCSHWRSWGFWAEAVSGGNLLARSCDSYDSFLRGECREAPRVAMGPATDPLSRGNFYLRTAAKEPYSLGDRGAD